ncbi:MAG: DUF2393 domain-containing protein [Sulfurimonas sp.]
MKEKITAFMNGLITYDYILFASVFGLFLLFMILAIVLRKRVGLSIFMLLFSFIILLVGSTVGYIEMHKYLFKNTLTLTSQKKLTFTPAIVVKGSLKNESNFDFERCKITASVHKVSKNALKNYIYGFKKLTKMSIVEDNINRGDTRSFKLIVEPFNYKRDYNISLKASCK